MALGRGWKKQEGALTEAVSTRHAFGWWPSSLSLCLLSAVKFTVLLSAFPHYVVLSCHGSRTTGQLTEEQNLWGCEPGYALLPFRCLLSYFVSVVKSLAYSRRSRAGVFHMVFALTGSLCEKFLSVRADVIYPLSWQRCGFLSVTWTFAYSFSVKVCTCGSLGGQSLLIEYPKDQFFEWDCWLYLDIFLPISEPHCEHSTWDPVATKSLLPSRKDWLRITSEVMWSLCLDMFQTRGSMLRGCHDKCLKNFIIEFEWVKWANVVCIRGLVLTPTNLYFTVSLPPRMGILTPLSHLFVSWALPVFLILPLFGKYCLPLSGVLTIEQV